MTILVAMDLRENIAVVNEYGTKDQVSGGNSLREYIIKFMADDVAFTNSKCGLCIEKLHERANELQELFDNGKTALKTTISFSGDYLEYKGYPLDDLDEHDQLIVCNAVKRGLESINHKTYDDLQYVGITQVDTATVHCHLIMIDAGKGTVLPDGNQRGKISQETIDCLRRNIDRCL